MAGGYVAPAGDQLQILADSLQGLARRLSELETPAGTSVNSLVAQVQQAIANINTTVSAAISANSYTKTQIDNKIANPPAGSAVTGNVSASGTVSSGGDMTVGGQLKDPDAVSFNITGTRYAVWIETATGRFGNTASSRRYKQDEAPAAIDTQAVLSVEPKRFHYIDEVRKRDDPTFEGYIGPEYEVATEFGLMAEDLHAAGLNPWVYFTDTESGPIPEGVDYTMFVVPLLAVARQQAADIADLRTRVAALETQKGA